MAPGAKAAAPNDYPEFTDNEYTAGGNWEAMETAGAVFLPAAGCFRYEDSEGRVGQYRDEGEYRINEFSVRLVRDVK